MKSHEASEGKTEDKQNTKNTEHFILREVIVFKRLTNCQVTL